MGGLNWIDPVAGGILAAAIIPPLILLYFLKLRRRTQPISCTILWKKSVEDLRANAPFQRLRKSLLLLLQLMALLMLILAIMQPQLRSGNRTGGRVVILIDNSASMNAVDTDSGRSRLDEAKEKAKNMVDSMQSSGLFGGKTDEIMVIGFNERASVYSNFTSSATQLKQAIDAVPPTDAGSHIDEALKLARAHTTVVDPDNIESQPLATGTPATLELFSDGRIADWAQHAGRGEKLNYYAIGSRSADNVAFAGVAAERPYDQPGSMQVFVSLVNFNDEPVTATIEMSVDGNIEAGWIRDVPIGAATTDPATDALIPGRSNVIFGPFPQPRGALINVRNMRSDDLDRDNSAWIITSPPRNLSVAFVAPTFPLVPDSIRGMPFVRRLDVLSATEFATLAETGDVARYDVVVLGGFEPEDLPPGRYLSLGTRLPIEALEAGEEVYGLQIADWQREHPILRFVNLDPIVIGNLQPLRTTEHVRVLVEAAAGLTTAPVISEFSDRTRHIIHVSFTMDESNWIWNPSFVMFMVNAIEYLSTVGEEGIVRGVRPLDPIIARLPVNATEITIRTPDGEESAITATDPTMVTWPQTPIAGIYEIRWLQDGRRDETTTRRVAVNLIDEQESYLPSVETLRWGAEEISSEERRGGLQTPLWPWAIAFCLFVLMLEWWVYHRRMHV